MRAKLVIGAAVGVFLAACGTGGPSTSGDSTTASYVGSADSQVLFGTGKCVRTDTWSESNTIGACEGGDDTAQASAQPVAQSNNTTKAVAKPAAKPAPLPEKVVLVGRAMFQFDSDLLSTEGSNEMRKLSAMLRSYKDVRKVEVVGHTDSNGSSSYNQALSERRAQTVKDWLQSVVPGFPVIATGAGESSPLASNDTREGRSLNRRVEIKVDAIR